LSTQRPARQVSAQLSQMISSQLAQRGSSTETMAASTKARLATRATRASVVPSLPVTAILTSPLQRWSAEPSVQSSRIVPGKSAASNGSGAYSMSST
jgi:hypothetical protein